MDLPEATIQLFPHFPPLLNFGAESGEKIKIEKITSKEN